MYFLKAFIFLVVYIFSHSVFSKESSHLIPFSYGIYNITEQKFIEVHRQNHVRPIASLTKLMTAYVFIKNMPVYCSVTVGADDIDLIKYTKSRLPKNEKITCLKLLNAMLVSSDNMAAYALSRSLPNMSRADFISLMNKQAKQWNMNRTFFVDPAGLDPQNVSTVGDLALLVQNVINEPLINTISAKNTTVLIKENGKLIYFNNTNRLVRDMGFESLLSKTGYINESGYNLIYSPQKLCNNKQLAFIILGSISSINRSNFAINKLKESHCINSSLK